MVVDLILSLRPNHDVGIYWASFETFDDPVGANPSSWQDFHYMAAQNQHVCTGFQGIPRASGIWREETC
jgi:hypothetical protein